MENKPTNGTHDPGPTFAVHTQRIAFLRRIQILEMLEKNAVIQGKQDITKGPLFRKIADDFRQWSRIAEPGQAFHAPEANLWAIRVTEIVPPYVSLSEAAERAQEESADPETFPRISAG